MLQELLNNQTKTTAIFPSSINQICSRNLYCMSGGNISLWMDLSLNLRMWSDVYITVLIPLMVHFENGLDNLR